MSNPDLEIRGTALLGGGGGAGGGGEGGGGGIERNHFLGTSVLIQYKGVGVLP